MTSKAATVEAYLASLPADRRSAVAAVRDVIRQNLDAGYEEGMQYGMIGYYVPHRLFPAGYHCDPKQPLPFAALASQKNYMSLYLISAYGGSAPGEAADNPHARWFRQAWTAAGKKLDMGKSCIRFKSLDDVPLAVVGEAIRRVPAEAWIAMYERSLATNEAAKDAKSADRAKGKPKAAQK